VQITSPADFVTRAKYERELIAVEKKVDNLKGKLLCMLVVMIFCGGIHEVRRVWQSKKLLEPSSHRTRAGSSRYGGGNVMYCSAMC
jgi:hypothetical protein